jgi:Fe-S cluster assembly protein SufD
VADRRGGGGRVTDALRAAFEALPAGPVPSWLAPLRRAGMDRFSEVGFPTARDEEWRFTPVAPIARTPFAPAASPTKPVVRADLSRFSFGHPEWPALVFVNGRLAPELSMVPALPAGVILTSLAEALVTHQELVEPHLARQAGPDATPFTALNAAFIQDGAFLRIPKDADLTDPVSFVFVTTADQAGRMTHPRNLVVVESGARASLVEMYVGLDDAAAYFTNTVTEVALGANAWLEHTRIQRESEAAYHVAFSHVHQDRDSHYRSFALAMGAAISRHNLHTRLDAPNTEALLYGLTIAHGDQLVDNHTAIYHVQPDCRSWEVYKAILDGRARGVFNGKVLVTPEAQKTDAKQTNRTLLLSAEAKVNTKPQLEIFADDVKCTHGAVVGYLDELPRFYFTSRGIPAARAEHLLTYAFAAEVLNEVQVEAVRTELDRVVRERLGITEG